ncbi:Nanos-like protein [Lamellibrachia satsuma]|nr:Nanos-like protein [Lamellibrachia satsuma]
MSTAERRLAIRRCFSGDSLVDELERLFIDHDSNPDTVRRLGRLSSAEFTGERHRCGTGDRVSRQFALRKTTSSKKMNERQECLFCRRNGEAAVVYLSHRVKDAHGKVSCPVLFRYVCPRCGATGQDAHTISHCPFTNGGDDVCNVLALNTERNSAGRRRYVRT